jgi:PAS domain S-box-containing protein
LSNKLPVLKSSVAKQFIALAVLVFAGNVLLLFTIWALFSRFETSLRQEQEARQVVACLSQFSSATRCATFALIERSRTEDNSEDRYSSVFFRLPPIFAELKHSLRNRPEDDSRLNALSLALDQAISLVHKVELSYWRQYSPSRKQMHIMYCSELIKVTNTIGELLTALDDKYRGMATAEDSINLFTSASLVNVLLLALLANTLVVIASFLFVVASLRRRIKSIARNAIDIGLENLSGPSSSSSSPRANKRRNDELSAIALDFRALARHLNSAKSSEALALDHAADFICLLDQKGILLRVSEASAKLLGYPSADLIGRRLNSIVEPGAAEALAQALRSLVQVESPISFESRIIKGTGEKRDFAFRAKLSPDKTIVCVANDVTEKNQLNSRIRQSEARFRTILNSLPLMVVGLSPSGQITAVNAYGVALSLFSQEELLGQSLEHLFSAPEEAKLGSNNGLGASTSALPGVDELVLNRLEGVQLMQKLRRKDGNYVSVELVLGNYADDGIAEQKNNRAADRRTDKKSLAFVRDVSVREQIEIAKRDFVNMIGHDLRSPLMSLSATLSYISKATSLPAVAEAEQVFYSLIALTSDFLYLGRLEAGEEHLVITQTTVSSLINNLVQSITASELTRRLVGAINSSASAASGATNDTAGGTESYSPLSISQPAGDFALSADIESLSQAITHLLGVLCSAGSGQSKYVIDFRHQPYGLEVLIVGSDLSLTSSILESLSQGYVSFSQATGNLRSGLSLGIAIAILGRHGCSLKQYQSNKQQGFHVLLPSL